MKTAGQIITYLEMELTDAYEMYTEAREEDDMEKALCQQIRATTLLNILEYVKQ